MWRIAGIYSLLLLLPGIILAAAALHLAGSERDEALRMLKMRCAEEADRAAAAFETVLNAARKRAGTEEQTVAFIDAAGGIVYDKSLLEDRRGKETFDAKEYYYFTLSLEGGESFELARREFGRAIDAYSFYMTRIRSSELRSRLTYRIARAALSGGKTQLAASLFGSLFQNAQEVCTGEGFPVAIVSGMTLYELADGAAADAKADVCNKLEELVSRYSTLLSTPFLRYLIDHAELSNPTILHLARERERLERAIKRQKSELETNGIALSDGALLVELEKDDSVRSVVMVAVTLPEFESEGRFETSFVDDKVKSSVDADNTTTRPVHVRPHSAPVGYLRVTDREYSGHRSRIQRLWLFGCVLVVIAIGATLGGGLALVNYARKERRLARLRSRLITNVSHELKSPVTSIRLFSDLLSDEELDEAKTRRFGKLLRSESMRLSQLIDNLLDFSRIGRKETAVDCEPVDIRKIIEVVAENFSYRAKKKKVQFDVTLPDKPDGGERSGLIALANAAAVERITLNFLDNALKYGVSSESRIRLEAARGPGGITVSVSDNGPGIAASEHEKIFEPFYRVNYDDYAVRGSGLGLPLARSLARKMAGDVTLESENGAGSTFILHLPVAESTNEHNHEGTL